ncbi:MAG TPA: hypothetical protein DCL41_06235 [Bdellovibrionales bacterium]|nr:hypothetical protein [Pseudobdellovibrionaceae bacterium]HAG91448.1 hypothetical protein [Bdellovibrionales bacterium]|tara:strand:+ start:294 stop:1103 length:810 start_codon:yes stop_codon:yes gene_type:complete
MKFLIAFLLSSTAFAYVLEYDTIISRTAKNHGAGAYHIQQVVEWKSGEGSLYHVNEDWWVDSESKMKLNLQGAGLLKNQVNGEIIYSANRRKVYDSGEKLTTTRWPQNFSPVFFHFRSSGWMKSYLHQIGMTGAESLQGRPPFSADSAPKYTGQNFVNLKRIGGTITYGIGTAQAPYLFIEQDQFVVTQVSFPTGATVTAHNYEEFSGGFYYPKLIVYKWGNNEVTVNLKRVTYLGRNPKPSVFQGDSKNPTFQWSDEIPLKEFYSLFR